MRNDARSDVWKVWLYAAAAVWLGAWMTPLLYNAGKALAEVSQSKTTNGPLEWLAGVCRMADFPWFYKVGLALAALVLFFPWMEWIHARRGTPAEGTGPWRLRLPDGARMERRGQWLVKNPQGLWHGCAGFLLAAGLLLSMGVALVPAGFFTMRQPDTGMLELALKSLAAACAMALGMEVFFRGIVMGIFLRAMRPAAALGMSAAFFALVLAVIPRPGIHLADAEAGRAGFELLRVMASRFADWRSVLGFFAPLLALGVVLAYARWRTASLWLPVGLHAGWWFAKNLLAGVSMAAAGSDVSGNLLQHGLIPLFAILIAGVLAHYLTATQDDAHAVRS
ncbi:MAG: CPBP family intramembrane metalloprotease [Luteolibacter sp.]|nr:CPBP family intramembrane metalloprotease [Luteolibacter sp.]